MTAASVTVILLKTRRFIPRPTYPESIQPPRLAPIRCGAQHGRFSRPPCPELPAANRHLSKPRSIAVRDTYATSRHLSPRKAKNAGCLFATNTRTRPTPQNLPPSAPRTSTNPTAAAPSTDSRSPPMPTQDHEHRPQQLLRQGYLSRQWLEITLALQSRRPQPRHLVRAPVAARRLPKRPRRHLLPRWLTTNRNHRRQFERTRFFPRITPCSATGAEPVRWSKLLERPAQIAKPQ